MCTLLSGQVSYVLLGLYPSSPPKRKTIISKKQEDSSKMLEYICKLVQNMTDLSVYLILHGILQIQWNIS